MFNLLFRFWPRKSSGTPNVMAPVASEAVFKKLRRFKAVTENGAGDFMC
jgi:hypothetical protein